jgi:hypothetical protein
VIFRRVVNALPITFLTRMALDDAPDEAGFPVIVPDAILSGLGRTPGFGSSQLIGLTVGLSLKI